MIRRAENVGANLPDPVLNTNTSSLQQYGITMLPELHLERGHKIQLYTDAPKLF